jgi:hypothetical protein
MSTTIESLELEIRSNSATAVKGIDALTQSLNKLKNATKNGLGLSAVSKETKKYADDMGKVASSNKKTSASFTDIFNKGRMVLNTLGVVGRSIKSLIDRSSEYNEVVNLFSVSLGKYANEAYEYANTVSNIMGIDTAEWMKSQGVFMTLATGFGVAGDRAFKMSEQLTQLGYDISSFQDISVEEAMKKLQAGLAGELEPLRRIGYDLSQAKLEATALELGINKSVSSMTQAEKAQLRYYAIMTQVTQQQGDMARTLDEPANQMRVLRAQFEMAARAVGNVFMPAVEAILPYLIALTSLVREFANSLASLVGYELPEVDGNKNPMVNAAETTSDAMDDATDSAKKLKSYMLGFDELNVINPTDNAAGNDSLQQFDFALPEYDFLSGATNEKIESIKKNIKEAIEPIKELWETRVDWAKGLDFEPIIEGFEKVGTPLSSVLEQIAELYNWADKEIVLPLAEWAIEESFPATLGLVAEVLEAISLLLSPLIEGVKKLKPVLEPIVSWVGDVLLLVIDSVASVFEKLSGVFEEKGDTITGIITGIGEIIAVVWEVLKPILDEIVPMVKTAFDFIGGVLAISIGIIIDLVAGIVEFIAGVFTGDWERAWNGIGDICIAIWDSIVEPLPLIWEFIKESVSELWNVVKSLFESVGGWFYDVVIEPVVGFFKGLWEDVSKFFSNLWDDIVGIWKKTGDWFDEKVVQPIVDFFEPIVESISDFFEGCWIIIQAVWLVASTWFNDTVVTPIVEFFKGLWEDISGFFTQLWTDISAVWKDVSTWFNETVVTPVVDFFKGVWTNVSGFFSSLWEDIKTVWKDVCTWFDDTIITPVKTAFEKACTAISGFFSSLWLSIRQGVAGAMNGVIGVIESAINGVIGGINNLIGGFDKVVQWAAKIIGEDWGGVTLIQEVKFNRIAVPTYAEGGFPEQGQMFIAREAGAEMVGNIGRRTAVANNDQIVSSISGGVAEANEEQNALLREQNSLLRAILEKDSGVYLDGKNLTNSVEKYQRERGRVLIAGGVV